MIKYHIVKGIEILFVGINPHFGSFSRGVPFSNNKNFWYLLSKSGIIKEKPEELRDDSFLYDLYTKKFSKIYKLGLLNVIDRPSRDTSDLKIGEETKGVARINSAIKKFNPKVVCFLGKVTSQKYSGRKDVKFGWDGELYGSRVFVARFPIRGYNSDRISELKKIKNYCEQR